MSHAASTSTNSPPWSATDSLGYSVWNRLIRPGVSPSAPAITVSESTSAIHDRHVSFLGALTTQPLGQTSAGAQRWVGDPRIFRRTSGPVVAGVHELWPSSVSGVATQDSARAERPAVMRRSPVGPSPTASPGGAVPANNQAPVSAALDSAIIPAGREYLPVPTTGMRVTHPRSSPAGPLTIPDATIELTPATIARKRSAPVSQSVTHPGVLHALSHDVAPSRSLPVLGEAPWSTSQPSSAPVAIDRATASATSVTGDNAVVGNEITAPPPAEFHAPVSKPKQVALSAPMSFALQSASALAPPVLTTVLMQRSGLLSNAASPLPVHDVRHGSDVSETIISSITHPMRHRQMALSRGVAASNAGYPALVPQNRVAGMNAARQGESGPFGNDGHRFVSVASLPINAGVSVGSITRAHGVDRQMIQFAVPADARSETPESVPAGTGMALLSPGPMDGGERVARFSSSIALQPASVGPPVLAPLDRRGGHSERGALRVAHQDVRVARTKVALSDLSVDLRVGSSPASLASLASPGIQQTVLRAAADDGALPLAIPARTTVSSTAPEDPAVRSYDSVTPFNSDGGSARATSAEPSASVPPPSASASAYRSPLAQVDRRSDYFERNVLPVGAQDTHIARVTVALSPLSVDLPGGSSPAPSANAALPGIQLTALRTKVADAAAFPLAIPAHTTVSPTAPEALAVRSYDIVAPFNSDGGSPPAPSASAALPGIQLTALRTKVADAVVFPLADIARKKALPDGPPAQSYHNSISAPLPSIGGFAVTTGRSVSRVERSVMPTEAESPILVKNATFGIIDLGDMTQRTSISAVPMTSFTSAVQRRRAEPKVISDLPVPAVRGVGESMIFTSAQPRSPGATWLLARNAAPPDVMPGHVHGGGTILIDASGQPPVNGTSARRTFEDGDLSFTSGLHNPFSMAPPRSDLPLSMASRRHAAAMAVAGSSAAGGRGPVPMPLVVARAASPGSAPYDQPVSALMAGHETSVGVGPVSDTPKHTSPHDSEADVDEIVERAWHALMSRLAIEQERRGFGRWT